MILRHEAWLRAGEAAGEEDQCKDGADGGGLGSALRTNAGFASWVRGLACDAATVEELRGCQQRLREQLDTRVFPMLERWGVLATRDNRIQLACTVHAHLLFLFKNIGAAETLDRRIVSTLLTSQAFVMVNYSFDIEAKEGTSVARADDTPSSAGNGGGGGERSSGTTDVPSDVSEAMGIPQTEVFDLFQRHRRKLLAWLEAHPRDCDEVMEGIVRIVTFTGGRVRPRGKGVRTLKARRWRYRDPPAFAGHLLTAGCVGHFVPDTEAEATKAAAAARDVSRATGEGGQAVTATSAEAAGAAGDISAYDDYGNSQESADAPFADPSFAPARDDEVLGEGLLGDEPYGDGEDGDPFRGSDVPVPSSSFGGGAGGTLSAKARAAAARAKAGARGLAAASGAVLGVAQRTAPLEVSFEEWLRETTTQSVDTEVDLQLGQFTLKKHAMTTLDDACYGFEDFVTIFGEGWNADNRMQVRLREHLRLCAGSCVALFCAN